MLDILNEWRSLPPSELRTIQCEIGSDCAWIQAADKPFYLKLRNSKDHANLQQALQEAIASQNLTLTLKYAPDLKEWGCIVQDDESLCDGSPIYEWCNTGGSAAIALLRAYVDCLKGLAENQIFLTGGDR